jgi:cold-inducible RNA-binding protein
VKLYIGNLPYSVGEEDLNKAFSAYGTVQSINLINDKETGRFRGFAFVEMDNASEAIEKLNGSDFGGRKLVVSEAREREPRQPRSGGGYNDRNGGERRGGYNR